MSTKSCFDDVWQLSSLSAPIICTALIQEIGQLTTLVYVGRLSNASLIGAMTLGNMMCNITGYSLAYGMCSALDTLISQSFGAKKYTLMGLWAQRAIVILTLCAIPVIAVWTQAEHILHYLLFIPIEEARLAGVWSRVISLALWPSLTFEVLRKFLQGQNIVWPVVVATSCGTTFNIVVNYWFMYRLQWGFTGVAFCWCFSQWCALVVLVLTMLLRKLYVRSSFSSSFSLPANNRNYNRKGLYSPVETELTISSTTHHRVDTIEPTDEQEQDSLTDSLSEEEFDPEDNWPALGSAVFTDWTPFLRLGIPGAASLFIEWGSFELAAGIAGQLGSVPLACHGIYMSTAGLFYMVPQAVAFSTATLVGNALGAAEHDNAQRLVKLGVAFDFVYGTVAGSLLLFVLRPYWGKLFTTDPSVQYLVYASMPVMFAYCVVDSTKCICLNILRNTGRPAVTVYGNIFACLAVLLPLGYFLGIHMEYGIIGVWSAMSIAWLLATFVYFYILVNTDWKQQAIITKSEESEFGSEVDEEIKL